MTTQPAAPWLNIEHHVRQGQPLTSTELDVLRRLATGAHDPEIARDLDVSTRTYRRYVTAMQRKLGARTRAHAITIGVRRGLIAAPVRSPSALVSCSRIACEDPATRGGLLVVQPNGLSSSHAVYYACGDHGDILAKAVETWPVATAVSTR